MVDYEKYKYFCSHLPLQYKIPINLTLEEQKEAIEAFEQLAYRETK